MALARRALKYTSLRPSRLCERKLLLLFATVITEPVRPGRRTRARLQRRQKRTTTARCPSFQIARNPHMQSAVRSQDPPSALRHPPSVPHHPARRPYFQLLASIGAQRLSSAPLSCILHLASSIQYPAPRHPARSAPSSAKRHPVIRREASHPARSAQMKRHAVRGYLHFLLGYCK